MFKHVQENSTGFRIFLHLIVLLINIKSTIRGRLTISQD